MAVTSTSNASNYHVFLSFRGQDTRHSFTGHLYKALTDKGIHTFIDDENLPRGDEITPLLVNAIQGSKIAIIVLSKHYASSSFSLEELATIIDCAQSKGLMVIPVFYMVDPSDVRHQRGSYGDALAYHEKRSKHNMDRLQKWKEALRAVAYLSGGYHIKEGDEYEYKCIESIIDWVSQKVNQPARLHVADYPVGLESRVAQVMKLLDGGSDDVVHMVGIHGMGGIGKSTLARAVYNNLIDQNFDGVCYLENVREESEKHGLAHLQNVLLQEILGDKKINVTSVNHGACMLAQRLHRKKLLLLIDDVDELTQLEAIVGRLEWYGVGSRVIITTRNCHLLKCYLVKRIYELKELNQEDALQLLTWKALKKEKADPSYVDVLNRVLTYASGLPLALEVIGSYLFGKSIKEWESAIIKYNEIPFRPIIDSLKVSFDTLYEEEKNVFLDIACCLKEYKLKEVEVMLSVLYNYSMKYHIDVLVDKSLIKVKSSEWDDYVEMHDLIQEMGRQIDKESHKKPQKRKRLWLWKDIIQVLKHNKGTCKIEIIYLDIPASDREEIIEWDGNGLKEMKNLKILIIKNAKFSEGPKCLPNSLRVLEWWGYPSNCLPSDFRPHNFVMCNLSHGCFTSFELDDSSKMLENITVLRFDECKSLTHIGDVSGLKNVKKFSFEWCDNLVWVHESIGYLDKVEEISAEGCRNLVSFPSIRLTSLERLNLSWTGLESFPEISGKMENIRTLKLLGTPIKELPISFVNLVGLRDFSMGGRESVVKLPSSILMMPELTKFTAVWWKGVKWVKEERKEDTVDSIVSSKLNRLEVSYCNLSDEIFSIISFTRFTHVTYLDLSGNNFTFLPECIKEFQALHTLNVNDCKHLRKISGVPPNLKQFYARNCNSLTDLTTRMFINQELYEAGMKQCLLPGAWIPEWFDEKSRGSSTSFWFRKKFPRKVLCFLVALVEDEILSNFPAPMVFINGKVHEARFDSYQDTVRMEMDYTYLFELHLRYDMFEVPLENEWNHVEVMYAGVIETSIVRASGIHVVKQESINEDIRYVSPYEIKPVSYDVFLSFIGSDTLHGFTGYLHKALNESGIHTYIDDEELQREEKIAPATVKAIEESRIAIIVLSINYASSSLCLDELASILDCPRKRMLVLPVFYNVDPSHVRHQTGSYGKALVKHEKGLKHNMEELQKWKMALHQVANLPGFYFKHGDGYEYEFIGRIVERVSSEINHTPLHVVGFPVGLEPQVHKVRELLGVRCDDVHMIGICGIGGVGKSTLTREVYNLMADHFDASCYIENVREKSKKHGLQHLQSILLSKILGEKDITLTSVEEGILMIQRRLQQKKVLLILDDADSHEQLEAVVGGDEWFGPGSRVIITTWDKQLLASHGVKSTYEMEKMRENDALQLLKWKAFKTEEVDPGYMKVLNEVVTYASGLPLALEIIGSNLFVKRVEEWKSAIQFEKSPDPIQVIFKASFDALEKKTRSIFLDIACCFKGYKLAEIQDILGAHYGRSVKDDIDALVDKSLLKRSHGTKPCYDTITLHDLIEDMGKEIEQQESTEPAKRRRLWLLEDIRAVLGSNMGTSEAEIICLDFPIFDKEEKVEWDGKAFQNMQNLKTIIIRNGNFSKGPEYLPNSLRVLEWWRYPSHCLPSDFHPKDLAICKLPDSHILPTVLTDLFKKSPNLKVLEFSSADV